MMVFHHHELFVGLQELLPMEQLQHMGKKRRLWEREERCQD